MNSMLASNNNNTQLVVSYSGMLDILQGKSVSADIRLFPVKMRSVKFYFPADLIIMTQSLTMSATCDYIVVHPGFFIGKSLSLQSLFDSKRQSFACTLCFQNYRKGIRMK